jgi:hypothetical protein
MHFPPDTMGVTQKKMSRFNRAHRVVARPRVQCGVRYIPLRQQKVLTLADYVGLEIRSLNKRTRSIDGRQEH